MFDWHIGGAIGGFPFGLHPKIHIDQKKEPSRTNSPFSGPSKRGLARQTNTTIDGLSSLPYRDVKKAAWMAFTGFGFDLPKKMFLQISALLSGTFLESSVSIKSQTGEDVALKPNQFCMSLQGGGEGIFGIKPGAGFLVGLACGVECGKFYALEKHKFSGYEYQPFKTSNKDSQHFITGCSMFLGPYLAWQFKKYYRIALRAQRVLALSLGEADYKEYELHHSGAQDGGSAGNVKLKHSVSLEGWRFLTSFEFVIPIK